MNIKSWLYNIVWSENRIRKEYEPQALAYASQILAHEIKKYDDELPGHDVLSTVYYDAYLYMSDTLTDKHREQTTHNVHNYRQARDNKQNID